tara:strand:+ start:34083 stop:34334 length:252 start_codon:yes stop_codon:yes gene_type:complete
MRNEHPDILTSNAQVDAINTLTTDQLSMIENCMDRMKAIKDDKKISERTLRELTSVMRELDALRELFYLRLFNSLKRGDMLLG